MGSIKFELEAETRADVGKGASRRLRHANKVPAVVYGANETPVALTLNHDKVVTALSHEAFYSHILTLKVGTKQEKVILKDIQRHPAKPRINHMDFLRIRADQKLEMRVPIHFLNEEEAPGVKEGGIITHNMTDIEVSCLPDNLPEYIEIDLGSLGMDETIHLADVKVPKGVEFTAMEQDGETHNLPVVSIHKPRIIEEEAVEIVTEEAAPAAGTVAAAPAAEKEKKE